MIFSKKLGVSFISIFYFIDMVTVNAEAAELRPCPNFSKFHKLLPAIDRQLETKNTLLTSQGPLMPRKSGYGFYVKEQFLDDLNCKVNTLYFDQKTVVNCTKKTHSKAQSQNLYDYYFECLFDQGWGQRSIYFIDPFNDITQGKIYAFADSFSIEFVQFK